MAKEVIKEIEAKDIKDMGKVMSELMPKIKGRAEGSLISRIIKDTLNLPSSFIPMAFFTVGQSLKTQQIPKRKELKDIIFKV